MICREPVKPSSEIESKEIENDDDDDEQLPFGIFDESF